jgi:hypothetical protein
MGSGVAVSAQIFPFASAQRSVVGRREEKKKEGAPRKE